MLESLGLRLALKLTSQVDWRLDVQQTLRHGQEKERLNVKSSRMQSTYIHILLHNNLISKSSTLR